MKHVMMAVLLVLAMAVGACGDNKPGSGDGYDGGDAADGGTPPMEEM